MNPQYMYILIEDDWSEGLKLVRSLQPEHDKGTYWGGNTKRVRAYVSEKHARAALKKFGRGGLLRVNLNDGEIVT